MEPDAVLIVGAGPTGLMPANQLARRGLRPLIIDRHPGPSLQTRALGVQARTLEIYAKMGLAERAIELGKRGKGAHLWSEGRQIGAVSLGDAGSKQTPYPFILVLGQDDNEPIMGEKLREPGVDVQWNTELLAIEQQSSHVVATLRQANGETRTVEAAWVAGCDGARSAVRTLSGIDFPGAPYEHVFFVADVAATGNMASEEVNVYLWRAGFHLFFPMRGQDHWRIVGIVPPQLRDKAGLEFADVIPSVQGQAGASLSIKACSWFSTYRIHHRAAARFRDRRCFLLGDAAHVHSPVGAQGMNTGLQDAYNRRRVIGSRGCTCSSRLAARCWICFRRSTIPASTCSSSDTRLRRRCQTSMGCAFIRFRSPPATRRSKRAHVPRSAFYLLRPDGHVGLCGQTLDPAALRHYFATNLALAGAQRHRRIAAGDRPTTLVASVVKESAC